MRISRKNTHANRGKFLEEVIQQANARYKAIKKGIVIKVPTEFIPIRGANGKVNNVKVETRNKGVPDFMGNLVGIGPVAFDAKETNKDLRFPFSHIEPEQVQWLQDMSEQGYRTFTVHYFAENDTAYLYPFKYMLPAYRRWEQNKRKGTKYPASVSHNDFEKLGIQIKPGQALALDYRAAIQKWITQEETGI